MTFFLLKRFRHIINKTFVFQQRFAYKLRSSNNEHYRVNPVFGFVEPNSAATITVDRLVCKNSRN